MTDQAAAAAAVLQMAVPLVEVRFQPAERQEPQGLAERRPEPDCDAGGPHRYPPGQDPSCRICGITPGAAALDGLAAIAEAKLRDAFA